MTTKKRTSDMLNLLARRSFAASRIRNLIAITAIMLTAILFTSVTTIGIGTMESLKLTMQMQKLSRSDGELRYMNGRQFEALKDADFIKEAGLRMPVGFLTNTKRHNVELDVMDKVQAKLVFALPSHGRMPRAANEIVTSDAALRELGVEPEIGAEVTIEFTAHGRKYSQPMVVSGWFEAINDQTSMMMASTAFRDTYPDIFKFTFDKDGDMTGTYFSDFAAADTLGLQEKLEEFSRSVGGNPDDMASSNYLPGSINTMTNPKADSRIIAAAAVLVALFVFCGYLLIYNVFDIAVMQEIRRFGLYRTIGMSKKQVKKYINKQAVWLACTGIPLGLLAGYFIGKATLPVVMERMAVEYGHLEIRVSPSPVIFLGAALLTAFTVYISTRKPVRVAANIPPVEAFRYVERSTGRRTSKKITSKASLSGLAWENLGRNRRRSVFIMISLMLCVVLLNCVDSMSASVDVQKQIDYMIRTDFAVVNAASMNIQKGFTSRDMALKEQTIADISSQPGVRDAALVYKNTLEDTDITYDFGMAFEKMDQSEATGLEQGMTSEGFWFSLGKDKRPICNVYGMEERSIARMDIREGETDAHVLYEKMMKGEGVLLGTPTDRKTTKIDEVFDFLETGDVITVYKDGRPLMELPILAKAALNGDDEEIGYTSNGAMEIGGDGIYLYLPAKIYEKLYEKPAVYKYAFDVEESQQKNMTAYLQDYMENTDTDLNFMSAESAKENAEGIKAMIGFVGGLLGLIFGIAGVLNLMNTLITTILSRRLEFAAMQSIGMTRRQLTVMMIFEGIYYAICACSTGVILAAVLDVTLVKSITGGMWYFTFQFTLLPALAASLVLLAVSAITPILALKMFNKGSIVEKLRIVE